VHGKPKRKPEYDIKLKFRFLLWAILLYMKTALNHKPYHSSLHMTANTGQLNNTREHWGNFIIQQAVTIG
jgi:hypothetical protein